MRSTDTYYGQRNGELCGLEFVTTRPIAQNEQLTHWYGPGWFKVREIKRTDVGTKRYPAPRREPSKKAKTSPGTKAAAAGSILRTDGSLRVRPRAVQNRGAVAAWASSRRIASGTRRGARQGGRRLGAK